MAAHCPYAMRGTHAKEEPISPAPRRIPARRSRGQRGNEQKGNTRIAKDREVAGLKMESNGQSDQEGARSEIAEVLQGPP